MSATSNDRRVAIVTGATRGIGRAVARQLATDGFAVVVNYRGDEDLAGSLVEEIQQEGGEAAAIRADVTNADEVGDLVEQTLNSHGRLDALVNNAGITRDNLMMRMSEADWDAVLTTNLKGAFLCSKAAIRPMMRQRSGAIVNLTSVVGLVGNPGQTNYAAAKAGLIGFTKSVAREMAARGITANAVAPGFIETDMVAGLGAELRENVLQQIPLGRMGDPRDVARLVAFLSSDAAGYITGQTIAVDGGMTMS